MMKRIYILFLGLLIIFSCQKREWNNPFDPDCPKESFTPTNFKAEQQGNVVKLSWNQSNTHISGFKIERKVADGSWAEVASLGKSITTWNDVNPTGGKLHEYRLYAFAGDNLSNKVTTHITPLFTATITTTIATNITSNKASSGGKISNDGGAPVTSRGVCWNTTGNPTISDSKTLDGTGNGDFTSTMSNLATNSTFHVRAYASNSTGTAYGNEIIFTTFYGEVTDIDGNVYLTIKIGNQIWMAENLRTTKYNDGTPIQNITDNSTWYTITTGAYCFYDNDISNKPKYGALYNWFAANTNKLAPAGWHVPLSDDWITLVNYLGGFDIAGGKMKSTIGWLSQTGDNSSGFTALPTGYRDMDGTFVHVLEYTAMWCLNETSSTTAPHLGLHYTQFKVDWSGTGTAKVVGMAIRCVLGSLTLPSITTLSVTNKTSTSVTCGGNISSDGGTTLTSRGVCWSVSPNPTTANSKTTDGTGTGSFTSNFSGLSPNTTYYVRAYAINSLGTVYGSQISFTTSPVLSLPTVTTSAVTTYTSTTALLGGNVTSDGNATITERGVCYSTSLNPTTTNNKTAIGSGTGAFSTTVTGLTANTTYYVRAYAINSQGTAYGAQVSFTTSSVVSLPTVTTSSVTTYTSNTALLGGNVTSDGYATVTERGVCFSTSQNPTTANNKTAIGSGTGIFSMTVTGLTANTTYFVRAYAINSQGTAYGAQVSFTTNQAPILPSIITSSVTTFTSTTAVLGGNVTSDGNATVTERGVCYSTSQNPTTANNKTAIGSGTGIFNSTVTGLTANTTYYVRAYAINNIGTTYGNQVFFKTWEPNAVIDIDGNIYKTVTIGTQTWMTENLKTTKYRDGAAIPNVTNKSTWNALKTDAFCWYDNDIGNKSTYGALFNWYAVNTGKLCPTGWHIPNNEDWIIIETFLGGSSVAGGKMMLTSGFSAQMGGFRSDGVLGDFILIGEIGSWWSATESNLFAASLRNIILGNDYLNTYAYGKDRGLSVRCIKD